MAQDWAVAFYHSPAWLRNRKNYMDVAVDTDGHVVMTSDDGGFYWTDEFGYQIPVGEDYVVPPKMCERCFKRGYLTPAKVVHHITWLNPENINDPHVTLGYSNFMRLCQDCHAAVHAHEDESRVMFDEHGNVVWRDE